MTSEVFPAKAVTPSARFDVYVRSFALYDHPAILHIDLEIAGRRFFSRITYHSIPSWSALWARYANPRLRTRLLGTLVAWECMRFLALGGERVILCGGLECDEYVCQVWTYCFRHQLGEWRYLNQLVYPSPEYPRLVPAAAPTGQTAHTHHLTRQAQPAKRSLLTNGGGKDTLTGMLLLQEAGIPFDLYAGFVPIGNNSVALQERLLQRLKDAAAPPDAQTVKVSVEDNFFSCPDEVFDQMGVQARHTKIDFAVGHTANYIGYFPVILHHQYTQVWFNIERSADNAMAIWQGEAINHQWCKSVEYQQKATELFSAITQLDWFEGFSSTLRGLYDISIYQLVAQHPALLTATHSCNYGKPWCKHCPKCCFCYLMMAAYLGEAFAQTVVGADSSLFTDPKNQIHWVCLLDADKVAWECVPSYEECQLAAYLCLQRGVDYPVLRELVHVDGDRAAHLWQKYTTVDWSLIPAAIRPALARQLDVAGKLFAQPLERQPELVAA